jgi:hypothetical protein
MQCLLNRNMVALREGILKVVELGEFKSVKAELEKVSD